MNGSILTTGGVYRVAFRHHGVPRFPPQTNHVLTDVTWLGDGVRAIQIFSEYQADEFGTEIWRANRLAVELFAHSPAEAVFISSGAVDRLIRLMEFQVGGPHRSARAIALIDVTPGLPRRLYRQWIYDKAPTKASRRLLPSEFLTTWESIKNRDSNEREATLRGMKWYTDAINEADPVDRFLKAWVGLEAIGTAVNKRLNRGAHRGGWDKCRTCLGTDENRARDEKQEKGIRHGFSVVEPSDASLFDDLKKVRNKLVHGEWPIEVVRDKVEEHVHTVCRVLGSCLLTLVHSEGANASAYDVHEPIDMKEFSDLSVATFLLTGDENALGELRDFLQIEVIPKASKLNEDGEYWFDNQVHIEAEFPCEIESFTAESDLSEKDGVTIEFDSSSPEFGQVKRR